MLWMAWAVLSWLWRWCINCRRGLYITHNFETYRSFALITTAIVDVFRPRSAFDVDEDICYKVKNTLIKTGNKLCGGLLTCRLTNLYSYNWAKITRGVPVRVVIWWKSLRREIFELTDVFLIGRMFANTADPYLFTLLLSNELND